MSLTRAEESIIKLIADRAGSKPDAEFLRQLSEAVANGINPESEQDRIRFTNKEFIDAFRDRVTKGAKPSAQMIYEICMVLSAVGKHNTFSDVPLRTTHVFNHLYEELVKLRKFDLRTAENVPDDINAINFQLMDYFEKKFGKDDGAKEAKQNLSNCVLMKSITTFEKDIAKLAISSNVASGEQINVVAKNLTDKPQVSQEYFDRLEDARRRREFERAKQKDLRKMDQEFEGTTTPLLPRKKLDVAAPKKSFSAANLFKRKDTRTDPKPEGDAPTKSVSTPKPGRKSSGGSE